MASPSTVGVCLGKVARLASRARFRPLLFFLGPQSLHVARHVIGEYHFELTDVMFGPLYF
jgi:hypothetical protein